MIAQTKVGISPLCVCFRGGRILRYRDIQLLDRFGITLLAIELPTLSQCAALIFGPWRRS